MLSPNASERGLFDACLDLAPAARQRHLEQHCSDPLLRDRVLRLLEAHDRSALLDTPLEETLNRHPTRIGPYEIIRPIGEGGMGIVYEALQTQPVRRHVALKIVRLGLDSRQVIARFEAERQALAVMDHPFIARVLDAGEDDAGRPYFAMELVQGSPLTEFCDENRLTLRQRLSLFVLICQAVQHAHHKGVIHRDLKPSNILVSTDGNTTLPRIIDFGIAKAIEPDQSGATALTLHGQVVGTPVYMSPEQAGMDGLDVDTRSDIFSLGVILYEILAGVLPRDPADGGFHRFLGELADRNITFPYASSRLEKLPLEKLRTIADLRSTTPQALLSELKGDLDWIVFAATEKERAHRYPTATALTDDIERYLSNRPVRARPPSGRYLLGKFLKRNTGGVAAASVALAAILAGAAGVTMALIKAQAAERNAVREAATARRVTEFLTGLFETADPNEARGSTITVKELLDRGSARMSRELRNDPLIEARLSQTLARVHQSLGLYPRSVDLARRAVAIAERHADRALLAASLLALGRAQQRTADYPGARTSFERALTIRESLLGANDVEVAEAATALAGIHWQLENSAEALKLFERALAIYQSRYGPDHPDIGSTLRGISMVHEQAGRNKEALEAALRALKVLEFTLGADHTAIADALDSVGILYRNLKQPEKSRPLHQRALDLRLRVLGPDHPVVAYSYLNLGRLASEENHLDAAQPYYEKGLALRERTLGVNHPRTADVAESFAILEARRGKLASSQRLFERSLASYLASYGPSHPETLESRRNLAILLAMRGRYDEAIRQLREAAEQGYAASLHLEAPVFSKLRGHPAWPALEASIALRLKQRVPERP